jgi:hypothetical protein
MSIAVDNRQVVLLKSLRTNNRFYTLVHPSSGLKNADTIEEFPQDLPLGIAYPCLEDGLNDFAVIRTTFETIDAYPDDEELRRELMAIIDDARGNLLRRIQELRDCILEERAHFLGTELQEFKDYILHLATRGQPRRTLDNMMKLDVFESVGRAEAAPGTTPEPIYRYEFLPRHDLSLTERLEPRVFIGRLFHDVLDEVTNDANYRNRYTFDKRVFQKFIAVMFTNYATPDPEFYGTSRDDYGVSSEKDMQDTPLYQAVAAALRHLEREQGKSVPEERREPAPESPEGDLSYLFDDAGTPDFLQPLQEAGHTVEIPFGAAERMLIQPLSLLAEALRLLKHVDHPHADEIRALAGAAGRQIFRGLQELNIVSPLAEDPIDDAMRD